MLSIYVTLSNIYVVVLEWRKDDVVKPKILYIRPSFSKDIPNEFFDGAHVNG